MTQTSLESGMQPYYRTAKLLGALTIAISISVIFGWFLDIDILKRLSSHWAAMRFNTAVCLGLCGLILVTIKPSISRRISVMHQMLAVIVLAITLATLSEVIFNIDLHVDRLLFVPAVTASGAALSLRMATSTAVCLTIFGAAQILWPYCEKQGRWFLQLCVLAIVVFTLFTIGAYIFQEPNFHGPTRIVEMAFHTAFGLGMLSWGFLLATPTEGFMARFCSNTIGGNIARRFVPWVILVEFGLSWIRLIGQRQGYYSTEFAVVLMAELTVVSFAALIWFHAGTLNDLEEQIDGQRRLLESVVTNLGEGVVVADAEGKFLLFNSAAERVLGQGLTDAPISQWSERYGMFMPDRTTPYASADLPLARACRGENTDNVEMFVRHDRLPKGVFISVTGRPLRNADGNISGGVVVVRDVTDLKQHIIEMGQLNATLQVRNAELSASNQELEAFSYSVSHDLRAPIRSIVGFTTALSEDCGASIPPEGKAHIARILGAGQRMAELIDGLLSLSRITRREITHDTVNLSDMARQIISDLQQRNHQRPIDLDISEGVVATGDAAMLRSLLQNLLENAWKYTGKQPNPHIEFGSRKDGDRRVYYVRDNGAGFDMAYSQKLFRPFQRLHPNRDFEGTGIGLATAQRIVHRLGGTIWAEAKVDQGASFYFTLAEGDAT